MTRASVPRHTLDQLQSCVPLYCCALTSTRKSCDSGILIQALQEGAQLLVCGGDLECALREHLMMSKVLYTPAPGDQLGPPGLY